MMPTVYRIWTDDRFQSLESTDAHEYLDARRGSWKFDGSPVSDVWKPLEVYIRRPKLRKPDIWGIADTFAFEDEAAAEVQLCLDQAGEQLQLPFQKRTLIVLNVTYVIDCLDKQRSNFDPDLPHIIDQYVFHSDRLDYSLFKIPETCMSEILTVEGIASPDDEFKPLVEKHRLKGLRFEKLWSND
jgi:hypothetical protein